VGEVLDRNDLVNLFLVADQKLSQAFITDMRSQGVIGTGGAGGEDGLESRGERVVGEFLDQPAGSGLGNGLEGAGAGAREPGTRGEGEVETHVDEQEQQPQAGPAVKGYIEEVMPELSRLSKTLGRCASAVFACCLRGERGGEVTLASLSRVALSRSISSRLENLIAHCGEEP